jgi:large subunit ribosomal protein L19
MSIKIENFNKEQLKKNVPDIKPGDIVSVYQKIKDKDKDRIQAYKGIVIAVKHGKGIFGAITVRRVVAGVGIERVFPLHAAFIEKIEIEKRGKTRRAKLYYLRDARGKNARLKMTDFNEVISEPEAQETKEDVKEEAPAGN